MKFYAQHRFWKKNKIMKQPEKIIEHEKFVIKLEKETQVNITLFSDGYKIAI